MDITDGVATMVMVVTVATTEDGVVITETHIGAGEAFPIDGDGVAHIGDEDTMVAFTAHTMAVTTVMDIILTTDLIIQEVMPILILEEDITEEQLLLSIDTKEPLPVQTGTLEHLEVIQGLQIEMATIRVKELQLGDRADILTHHVLG